MVNRQSSSLLLVFFLFVLSLGIIGNTLTASGQTQDRVGWWKFDDQLNPLNAVPGYGLPLSLVGSHQVVLGNSPTDYAVEIGPGSYYSMNHQIQPNGGGNYVNEYTLQIDFKVPSINNWHCFFQTNPLNNNDGDCFINPSGKIGVAATGYAAPSIATNTWYRLVVTVDNGSFYNYYIDGNLLLAGNVQDIDDRFSLDDILLMFADEDGEDNLITVSEIGIWDRPLSALEVAAVGGFGHILNPSPYFVAYPFIQTLTENSVYISWHDTLTTVTKVEYGLTESLGMEQTGSSELLAPMYRWHTVKLIGLTPATKYFYRLITGSATSPVYHFKTMPPADYQGHVRFLLFSDTQDDSAATGFIVRSAKEKMIELYGEDLSESINLIAHTGDITGNGGVISYWTDQFMRPFSPFTPYVPFLSVAGNHEIEHLNYYTYMKYDDISAFPQGDPLFEKIWTYNLPRVLLVGLNTNVIGSYGETQRQWLDDRLAEAQNDTAVDFVFCFLHHPPVTELWGEGNTSYVEHEILGVLKKYSKLQQLSYGHTHAYERGVIESEAPDAAGDFRISCVGGGGGNRDRWGEYTNVNYPFIHIALDHYFYVLFDFDLASRSYTGRMFDLGNTDIAGNNEVADTWHRDLMLEAPEKPAVTEPAYTQEGRIVLHASEFAGSDEIMSSQFQISDTEGDYSNPILSSIRNWQDIYEVDAFFGPIDQNDGIDLTSIELQPGTLSNGVRYYYRARYRDQNLRWSPWSEEYTFIATDTTSIPDKDKTQGNRLRVIPDPSGKTAAVNYTLGQTGKIRIKIFDSQGKELMTLVDDNRLKGEYHCSFNTDDLTMGVYYCRLGSENGNLVSDFLVTR
jgi:hypothetical protein